MGNIICPISAVAATHPAGRVHLDGGRQEARGVPESGGQGPTGCHITRTTGQGLRQGPDLLLKGELTQPSNILWIYTLEVVCFSYC